MGQVLVTFCDYHESGRIEAEPYTVTVNGETVEVDLCEVHQKPLVDLLNDLRLVGRVEKKERSRGPRAKALVVDDQGQFPCPDCERTFQSPQGLGAHRTQQHDYRPEGLTYQCTICDKGFGKRAHLIQHYRGPHKKPAEEAKALAPELRRPATTSGGSAIQG